MSFGYLGKILWIDLSSGISKEEILPDNLYHKFLSGSGMAAPILYREIPPKTDALGPDNVLGFVSGLLTSTGTFFTGRWMAVGKSPLTGRWGEANCGGTLSPAIKRAGYDGIYINGISHKPVYALVVDGKTQLMDASDLWGLDAIQTQTLLRQKHGTKCSIACIGQAGEKLSLIAGIVNDGARMAARSGLGAVMGSKHLKALVVSGTSPVKVKQPELTSNLNRTVTNLVKRQIPLPPGKVVKYAGMFMRWLPVQLALDGWFYKLLLRKWGTSGFNQIGIEMGDTPVKNWGGTYRNYGFRKSRAIDPDIFIKQEKRKYHCFACPLGCGGVLDVQGSEIDGRHKPEYETIQAWSSLILNEDTSSIFLVNDKLNAAGMDSISAGATVSFAIECFENGLLTQKDTDGLELKWGNTSAILALLDRMIAREGIGDLLADGSKKAAERIGKNSKDFAMQAGGQELAFHDPRYDPGMALHAVVEPTPGNHTKGAWQFYEMFRLWTKVKELPRAKLIYWKKEKYRADSVKAEMAAACSQYSQVLEGSGICLFGAFLGADRLPIFEWLNSVCGWVYTPEEYMQIGLRIQTIKQLFNAREGGSLRHAINKRLLGIPPQKAGAGKGYTVNLDKLVKNYWQVMGWNTDNGKPTEESIRELELNEYL
jgi:aldehyde:ferredoxin oxidoreductase